MSKIKDILKSYFKHFSNKDIIALEQLFSESVKLNDWEISAIGKKEVVEANKKIFNSVDTINVELRELYIDEFTATCLIEILINKKEKLKVIDLIKFNKDNKITYISAYKQ